MRTPADVWTTSADVRTRRTSGRTFSSKNVRYVIPVLTTVHLTTGILTLMLETLSLSSCVTCIRFLKLAHVFIVASESFLLVCSVQVKFAASCRGYL
jgi:hypothetical protein